MLTFAIPSPSRPHGVAHERCPDSFHLGIAGPRVDPLPLSPHSERQFARQLHGEPAMRAPARTARRAVSRPSRHSSRSLNPQSMAQPGKGNPNSHASAPYSRQPASATSTQSARNLAIRLSMVANHG